MIFDFQRAFTTVLGDTVPDAKRQPNLTIPRSCPMSGKPPSGVAFYLRAAGAENVDVGLYALVEDSDDTNAVDNFAAVQEQANEWVPVDFRTLTNGGTPGIIRDLTPGRYYLRISGGTSTSGTIYGALI